jgi:hypothetical protein
MENYVSHDYLLVLVVALVDVVRAEASAQPVHLRLNEGPVMSGSAPRAADFPEFGRRAW